MQNIFYVTDGAKTDNEVKNLEKINWGKTFNFQMQKLIYTQKLFLFLS